MPTYNSSVEYSANSRSSNINIVYHDNEIHTNGTITQTNQKSTLKKGECPTLFERSSNQWWNLRFDSKALKEQFKVSASPQFKNLFFHSAIFTCLSFGVLAIYFAASQQGYWIPGLVWALVLACFSLIFSILSKQDNFYKSYSTYLITTFILLIAVTGLVSAYHVQKVFSIVGSFYMGSFVILLMYLNLPIPISVLFPSAVIFSIVFEVLLQIGLQKLDAQTVVAHILLLVCLHIVGLQMIICLQIVCHSTFWKLCWLVKSTEAKKQEERFKTMMIKTVMPLTVAEKLMLRHDDDDDDQDLEERRYNGKKKIKEDSMFRPFTMERMDNVSILYADIVGFTQMSSNKTAAELVQLLNDLFGRFDHLCQETGCEKISTLGDCYYCVAGCPISRTDHAICCVKMGLGMVAEIKEFCKQNNINVNMRVGIHTGYVLCGVVGTRRYKFDVWSNDVSLANGMEQHGIPGRVHISQATLKCLDDKYIVEDSKLEERDASFKEKTGTTYLIVGPKDENTIPEAKKNGGAPNNNLESNSSTKDPLLTKQPNISKDNEIDIPTSTVEDVEPTQNSTTTSRPDQLSQLLEQHFIPIPILSNSAMKKMRKEEDDLKFIHSIKDDPIMSNAYTNKNINPFTLRFDSNRVQRNYHNLCTKEVKKDQIIEYAISPRYRLFWDIVISTVFTLLLFVSSILLLQSPTSRPTWIIVFIVFFLILVIFVISGGMYIRHTSDLSKSSVYSLVVFLSRWSSRHIIGLLFLLVPAAVVFSHVNQQINQKPDCSAYTLLFLFVIVHFLNYNQLSTYFRLFLSIACGVAALLMVYITTCSETANQNSITVNATSTCPCNSNGPPVFKYEFIVDVILIILFVAFVNRLFELNYKLNFFVDNEIRSKLHEIKKEKIRVDQLLKNFIPPHVREAMQDQPLYSKTHKKVGVIFATIVNFNELYEESFQGGKEFLRFLSELISDVDDLLNKENYKDIEKIKTIGTTFMLASGLNPDVDQESTGSDSHLCRLMEFCIDMQDVVDIFNKDMLNFQLVLRIGFNYGEVTAGVIGTTKRLYDIWGDTVNIASRMDSTGVPNRVQVSEESMKMLKNHFEFEYIGEKFVKGKGQMRTYLLVRENEHDRKITPNPKPDYQPFY